MKLVRHPCDIRNLISSQAWVNYEAAMNAALRDGVSGQERMEYRTIAALSARAWFDSCERLLVNRQSARAALAGGKWEPWV